MSCEKCGHAVPEDVKFCPYCGAALGSAERWYARKPVEIKETNMFGYIGFIVSIVSAIANIFFFIPGVAALALCIVGMVRRHYYSTGYGYAKAGLAISIVFLAVWIALWIWAAYLLDHADSWA